MEEEEEEEKEEEEEHLEEAQRRPEVADGNLLEGGSPTEPWFLQRLSHSPLARVATLACHPAPHRLPHSLASAFSALCRSEHCSGQLRQAGKLDRRG